MLRVLATVTTARTMAVSSPSRGEPLHEGPVDLERVHREALEVAERRVAGAEVVDGEADAEVLAAP